MVTPEVQEKLTLSSKASRLTGRSSAQSPPSPEAKARVGDIWAGLSALSRKPAYFFKVMAVSGDTYHCQRCKQSGELKDESTAFTLKAEKLSGTHRLFQLHRRG